MNKNTVEKLSFKFAVKIIKACQSLVESKKEYVLSKQILRSGTSIGALISEAQQAESKKDFIHKLSIALKEAYETRYWLKLLVSSKFLQEVSFERLMNQCNNIISMLVRIIKTSKMNLNKSK